MAFPTKRNEIRLDIITKCAAPSHVVNIEILKAATYLTAPSYRAPGFLSAASHTTRTSLGLEALLRKGVAHFAFSGGSDGPYVAAAQPNDAEDS